MDISSLITYVAEKTVEQAAETGGVIGTLGLNWKLFIAQLVNFGIVLFILWRWVFRPVGGALESRRVKIEASVEKAREIEERLKQVTLEQEELMKRARQESQEIIKKSQVAAAAVEKDAVEKARQEAEKIIQDTNRKIQADKARAIAEAREELANLTVMATERILRSKLDKEKDKELIEDLLKQV